MIDRGYTTLDPSPIGGAEFRIHPLDYGELRSSYLFVWPQNAPRNEWNGVSLIVDAAAERLPRKAL